MLLLTYDAGAHHLQFEAVLCAEKIVGHPKRHSARGDTAGREGITLRHTFRTGVSGAPCGIYLLSCCVRACVGKALLMRPSQVRQEAACAGAAAEEAGTIGTHQRPPNLLRSRN